MDLSHAYGASYLAKPLGSATEPAPVTADDILPTQQASDDIVPMQQTDSGEVAPTRRPRPARDGDMYMIHLEIGRDDAHLLCIFIAALILTMLFTSRK